jgi:peptidoglycan/xylan/chitin deacetylase (PgdA/CDA1 family)
MAAPKPEEFGLSEARIDELDKQYWRLRVGVAVLAGLAFLALALNIGYGYVFARSSLTAIDLTEPARRAITLQLRPGEFFSTQVAVQGPDPRQETIVALAPVPPAVASVDAAGAQLVLRSTQALTSVQGAPQGSWRPAQPSLVRLERQTQGVTYHLDVVGRSGGEAVWDVQVPALPEVPVVWFGSAQGGSVYLTIDDGWYPSAALLQIMQRDHVPVTAFLVADAALAHPAFWRAFTAAGGLIEDHTVDHKNLAEVGLAQAEAEWRGPIEDYPAWFGVAAPTLGRPPYGAITAQVRAAAWAAGLKEIVMWGAQWIPDQGFETWNGAPIQAGDIILLHWVPGVGRAVARLLQQLDRQGLHPAPLLQGLGG